MARSRWTASRPDPRDTRAASERGFSLLEVLVAITVMLVGAASLAQLFVVSTKSNSASKSTSMVTLLAKQKMEQLRGLEWGFDSLGLPVSDTTTNTAVSPQAAAGGSGLSPSPPGTLNQNTVGWVDYLDQYGNSLGGAATTPPAGSIYLRRWSVEPLPTNPNNTLILQVLVAPLAVRNTGDTTTSVTRRPQEARLVSVKTRKAS